MKDRIDLTKYMKNKDKPNGNSHFGWYAGEQLTALKFYLDDKINFLETYMEDEYQGNCFALLKIENTYILWRDSFGSCSGCDALEDENGYDYIKNTLQEGNTRQFATLDEVKEYLMKTEDFFWKDVYNKIFR